MRPNSVLILLSLIAAVVCFWHRNDIPAATDPAADAPQQRATDAAAFSVRYAGIDYRIEPQFDYELIGRVVSFRHHDGGSRMHRQAGDHLNMLDVCLIWGTNERHPDINALDFWNGIFTCNVSTRDRAAWDAFDMHALSNNHLISAEAGIRDAVREIAIGDRVRVRGWLSSYTGPAGTRGTSTTRTDTGDGACETIYVQEFTVLAHAQNRWVAGLYASLATLFGTVLLHFRRPYRPHARR